MASWAGVLAAVEADLTLAAADVNALYPSKEPFVPKPGDAPSLIERRLRFWYGGDQESETGGRTLTRNNVQEKLTIRWYFPLVNAKDDRWLRELEIQLEAANRATQKYLMLDEHMKNAGVENAIGLSWSGGTAGWTNVGESWSRVLTIEVLVDMAETEVIGTL